MIDVIVFFDFLNISVKCCVNFLTPKDTSSRRTTSYDVSNAKIRPTILVYSMGARKNWKSEVNIRRFWVYIWRIWGKPWADWPLIFLVVDIRDVITCFKFGDDRFRGLASAEGQILQFPIDFDGRACNTHTTVWACDHRECLGVTTVHTHSHNDGCHCQGHFQHSFVP